MVTNVYFQLSHFPWTPRTLIPIAYFMIPFGYLIGILSLTCPKPNYLSLSQMYFTCSFPYLGGCQQCFQSARSENLLPFLTHPFFPFLIPNTADNSFGSAFKIYLDSDHYSFSSIFPPGSSHCHFLLGLLQ